MNRCPNLLSLREGVIRDLHLSNGIVVEIAGFHFLGLVCTDGNMLSKHFSHDIPRVIFLAFLRVWRKKYSFEGARIQILGRQGFLLVADS